MTLTPLNPFAQAGAGSEWLRLHADLGADFVGSDDQRELTPFQRQAFSATKAHEAEQKEQKQQEMREEMGGGGGHSRPRNSRASGAVGGGSGGGGGNKQSETVRYINTSENPDYFDDS